MENIKSFLITGKRRSWNKSVYVRRSFKRSTTIDVRRALSSKILNKTNCEISNNVFYLQEIRYLI